MKPMNGTNLGPLWAEENHWEAMARERAHNAYLSVMQRELRQSDDKFEQLLAHAYHAAANGLDKEAAEFLRQSLHMRAAEYSDNNWQEYV